MDRGKQLRNVCSCFARQRKVCTKPDTSLVSNAFAAGFRLAGAPGPGLGPPKIALWSCIAEIMMFVTGTFSSREMSAETLSVIAVGTTPRITEFRTLQ